MKKYVGLAVTLVPAWVLGNSDVGNYYKAGIAGTAYAYAFYVKWYKEDELQYRGFESCAFAAATASTSILRYVLNHDDAPMHIIVICGAGVLINHAMVGHRFYESVRDNDASFVYV